MSRAHRGLTALAGLPLALLLACGGTTDVNSVPPPNAGDTGGSGGTYAQFDPANNVIPLPNLLLTATTTAITYSATPNPPAAGTLNINPGVPLTPDRAVNFLNLREAGGTSAVSGLNAPVYIAFSANVDASTINASNVRIFRVLPDTPTNPSSFENNLLGFQDVSAAFTYRVLPSGREIYAMPRVPLLPGARYVYVVTNGVQDTNGRAIGASLTFSFLRYVRPSIGATNAATDTTNLTDFTDTTNPAVIAGASSAALLEQIAGNRLASPGNPYNPSTNPVVLSGYRKTMWDLMANAAADTSGKAGATATGITARANISLLGRFITTSTGATRPDPIGNPASLLPVETALWGWANNANLSSAVPGADFSGAETRTWTNGVSDFQVIASSSVADPGAGSIGSVFGSIPHSAVGQVAWGSFEGANLPMEPYVTQQNLAVAGGNLDGVAPVASAFPLGGTVNAYHPGTSTVPGTGTLIAFRNGTGTLRGYYHTTRRVPFVIITPAASPAATTYPVAIFMHGIGQSKENILAMANAACASGYAVVAIDQAVHGLPAGAGSLTPPGVTSGGGNGRPQAEWASNFFMLPSPLTARANIYQSAFNLWRLARVLAQPVADPTSLQAAMTVAGKPIATAGATQYIGQSLGSIVGAVFLAGNSSQTGGSNPRGLLSVPGGQLAWILHDSPAFKPTVDAGLAAAGVPTDSVAYNQFFVLAQTIVDSADPASMATPISSSAPSRLAGRLLVQEAVGDLVIPNTNGRYFVNALAGRSPQLGADVSTSSGGPFSHVAPGATATVPFIYGGNLGNWATIKAAVAPAVGAATSPTQGVFQFGTTATPATHGFLLDGSANTAAAQTQMSRWLGTGLVTDGAAAYPITESPAPSDNFTYMPEQLRIFFPTVRP